MDCSENNSEPWNWQGNDFPLQIESNFDFSKCLRYGVTENQEDLSYMFDEATPVKACGDLSYLSTREETMNKGTEEFRVTSSQVKRRRMLQFNTETRDPTLCNEDISSVFLNSKEAVNAIDDAFPDPAQWASGLAVDASASSYEVLDQSEEGWLSECLNVADVHLSADDMNTSGVYDDQVDIRGYRNIPSEHETSVIHVQPTRGSRKAGFKGRKAYLRPPPKIASSIAYPFAFVKPCAFHGDVTLKDINQRIRTPPKSTQSDEDSPDSYPTSAFSGKPVVGKTKIHTDGGKGSITIMRTRG